MAELCPQQRYVTENRYFINKRTGVNVGAAKEKRMKYEWEKKFAKDIQKAIEIAGRELPDGLYAIGLAVEHEDFSAAALVKNKYTSVGGPGRADVFRDIRDDAKRLYDATDYPAFET